MGAECSEFDVTEAFEYDALGRPVKTTQTRASTGEVLFEAASTLGPDGKKLLVREVRGATVNIWEYTYAALGRLASEKRYSEGSPGAPTVHRAYAYDADGNRLTIADLVDPASDLSYY